jgi:hypothetical protein
MPDVFFVLRTSHLFTPFLLSAWAVTDFAFHHYYKSKMAFCQKMIK